MNETSKNLSMRSTKVLLVKKEYEEYLSLKEIIWHRYQTIMQKVNRC